MNTKEKVDALLTDYCECMGCVKADLLSRVKSQDTVLVRQLFAYILVKILGFSTTKAGEVLNRDHATMIHSVNRVEDMFFTKDRDFMEVIVRLQEWLELKKQ
jgi:chromosomal replication initiation ATPase DnaA